MTLLDLKIPVIRPALIFALLLPAAADEVLLSDGSRLSGTVTELADGGLVMLSSSLSFEPFQLRAENLTRVDFTSTRPIADRHDALVILANGDQFPADLKAIDENLVTVGTSFAGEIRIPRASVSTVQFGVMPRKLIYQGPEDERGWDSKGGWRMDEKRFLALNSGTIGRQFDIPGSFALSFRVGWSSSPNIQIYFAADSLETTGKADRYYLQLGNSGLELKRQQSGEGGQYPSMASIQVDPAELEDNELDVELRVDRKLGFVHLYLDGEYEGKFKDPVKALPTGQGIMFRSNIGGDDRQFIDRIELREWDVASDRHRREERGDETQDVLITRSSDRGTGSILGLTPGPDGGTVRYKGPHHPDAVELPVAEVSTLFFSRAADAPAPAGLPLELGLRSRGSLGVSDCAFEGESILATHPLLGKLTIRRDAVANLLRADKGGDEDGETEEEDEDEEEGDR
jgi:hypothetical protein